LTGLVKWRVWQKEWGFRTGSKVFYYIGNKTGNGVRVCFMGPITNVANYVVRYCT
jgi:hypothetical protein